MLIDFKLCYDDEAGKFVALNEETGEIRDFKLLQLRKQQVLQVLKRK